MIWPENKKVKFHVQIEKPVVSKGGRRNMVTVVGKNYDTDIGFCHCLYTDFLIDLTSVELFKNYTSKAE